MKIALFHNVPPGGAERVVYEQIHHLQENHSVILYTIPSDKKSFLDFSKIECQIKEYFFAQAGDAHGIKKRILSDFNQFVSLQTLHKKIAFDIDKQKFDLVIVHPDKFTQSPYLLQFLHTPHIYYCEELLRMVYEEQFAFKEEVSLPKIIYEHITRSIRRTIDKQNAQAAQKIVANSAFTAENARKAYYRKTNFCYPGVDTALFKPNKKQKKYDILFIGEKNTHNGYDLLQRAINTLSKKPSIHFLDKTNKKTWENDTLLVREYNNARIVVGLTRNEPFGMIPLEAMACDVPVIAINEGGYKETIVSGKTGLLVNPNAQEVANAIKKLLTDDQLRKTLGRNGRIHVKKNFSWRKHVDQLLKFVNEK